MGVVEMNEREANEIPKGPRWLWDGKWWAMIIVIGVVWYALRVFNGTI